MAEINEKQREQLIEFMKTTPNIVAAKYTNTFTYKDAIKKWEQISEIVFRVLQKYVNIGEK